MNTYFRLLFMAVVLFAILFTASNGRAYPWPPGPGVVCHTIRLVDTARGRTFTWTRCYPTHPIRLPGWKAYE